MSPGFHAGGVQSNGSVASTSAEPGLPRRSLRRSRLLLFTLLVPLALLGAAEGCLRLAGSLIASRHDRRTSVVAGTGDLTIWALGDSYTFGIGADDPPVQTWPMVAALALQEGTGRRVQLRNLATPGANSTEIVDAFARGLDAGPPPDVVLLLAGVNNSRWLGGSGQFCLEDDASGRIGGAQLRRLRLVQVMQQGIARVRPADPERACVSIGEGFGHLDDGYPDRADRAFAYALASAPEAGWAHLGSGLADLRVARAREALDHFERARELGVDPPALGLAAGFAARAAGDLAGAERASNGDHPGDLAPFADVLRGWIASDRGDPVEAIGRFEQIVVEGDREGAPGGPLVWALDGLGWARLNAGDAAGAERAFDRSITLGASLHLTPHLLGWSHVGRAVLRAERGAIGEALADLELASRDSAAVGAAQAYRGWLLATHHSVEDARAALAASRAVTPELALADALEVALVGRPDTDQVDAPAPRPIPRPTIAVQQWIDPADTRLIRADLTRAATLAANVGATLVLTTYPQPRGHPELAEAAAAVAADAGLVFVDPRPEFQAEHDRLGSWQPLLIPDGHPTTAGYRLMGESVAARLLETPHPR